MTVGELRKQLANLAEDAEIFWREPHRKNIEADFRICSPDSIVKSGVNAYCLVEKNPPIPARFSHNWCWKPRFWKLGTNKASPDSRIERVYCLGPLTIFEWKGPFYTPRVC